MLTPLLVCSTEIDLDSRLGCQGDQGDQGSVALLLAIGVGGFMLFMLYTWLRWTIVWAMELIAILLGGD